jgi:hypothetical protein
VDRLFLSSSVSVREYTSAPISFVRSVIVLSLFTSTEDSVSVCQGVSPCAVFRNALQFSTERVPTGARSLEPAAARGVGHSQSPRSAHTTVFVSVL